MDRIFTNLHSIHKNLQFWRLRAEGSNSQKVYFMMFERGPGALVNGTFQLFHEWRIDGKSFHHLSGSASAYIAKRVAVFTSLQCSLAEFLAQFYVDVERHGVELVKDPERSLPSLLTTVGNLFSKLEASIVQLHSIYQNDFSAHGSSSIPLLFDKLPEVNQEGSQWTDCEIRDAANVVYQNLDKLDLYLSRIVSQHQKPHRVTLYWVRYTCGAVALSACSLWLLRHSRVMGSPDIDNWICEAKDSTTNFFHDHVQQPLLAIRDELFETFRKRHKGVMEVEEVQLTASSLHRMLLSFSEQTKGQRFPENASDQEMLEIVMARYEKELVHPVQNLVSGELARALLIQVQKLKLDIETAMLELDQILKANEINFAVLAALPAFFLSLLFLMLVRAWYKQDTRAQGRGRIARIQRRLLIVEVEKRIMQYQNYVEQGLEKDALCTYGLVLYSLDCLYHAVESHAKATGEWQWLREDIIDLARA
ncbi:protein DGS1, mitochondrial-like [Rutidosis leptorrhynchoides]|uniref:protein DGS1, mitochondrial-like n=1 Tax=Rutidosis leptorrhynchoides TaxID=125765 RepID=UPI003A991BC9